MKNIYIYDYISKKAVKKKVLLEDEGYVYFKHERVDNFLDREKANEVSPDEESCLQRELDLRIKQAHRSMESVYKFAKKHRLPITTKIELLAKRDTN